MKIVWKLKIINIKNHFSLAYTKPAKHLKFTNEVNLFRNRPDSKMWEYRKQEMTNNLQIIYSRDTPNSIPCSVYFCWEPTRN